MKLKSKNVVKFPKKQDELPRTFSQRWGGKEALFAKGYLAVPSLFLQNYARLNPPLNSGEAMFVVQLMDFKWNAEHPFPGYKTIAGRMGVSDKMARTHAQSLEIKKYLRRQIRVGQTNRFDLSLLFEALTAVTAKKKTNRRTCRE